MSGRSTSRGIVVPNPYRNRNRQPVNNPNNRGGTRGGIVRGYSNIRSDRSPSPIPNTLTTTSYSPEQPTTRPRASSATPNSRDRARSPSPDPRGRATNSRAVSPNPRATARHVVVNASLSAPRGGAASGNRSPSPGRAPKNGVQLYWPRSENARSHRTDLYDTNAEILRRGQAFTVNATLGRPLANDDMLKIEFSTGTTPSEAKGTRAWVLVSIVNNNFAQINHNFGWSGMVTLDNPASSGQQLEMQITPSAVAAVGRYTVKTLVVRNGAIETTTTTKDDVIILFNPWEPRDLTHMPNEAERTEYVMSEFGTMYVGSHFSIYEKPWHFAQFDAASLEVALYLLSLPGLTDTQKSNPILVSRHFSGMTFNSMVDQIHRLRSAIKPAGMKSAEPTSMKSTERPASNPPPVDLIYHRIQSLGSETNSNDFDGGVVVGRWTDTYPRNSVNPTSWIGSNEILEKFLPRKQGVKYGQCWVFAGINCTLNRTIGIPCRCVSNFASAHDTDMSNSIDFHVTPEGDPIEHLSDSVWNFHVWNEVWLARPDLPRGYDGWQIVDGTPQERSHGKYQLGPASVKAVKEGEVYHEYDTGFVFSEVNGDRLLWEMDRFGGMTLKNADPLSIGKNMSTKAVLSRQRVDVTNSYKYPEKSTKERETVCRAFRYGTRRENTSAVCEGSVASGSVHDEVKVKVEFMDAQVMFGQDVVLQIRITNQSPEDKEVSLKVSTSAVFYTGRAAGVVDTSETRFNVRTKRTEIYHLVIEGAKYLPVVTNRGGDVGMGLKVLAVARCEKVSRTYFDVASMVFLKPSLTIQIHPQRPVVGQQVEVTMSFVNPLNIPISSGTFRITGLGTNDAETERVWPFRQIVNPGGVVSLSQRVVAMREGNRIIIGGFNSEMISGVTGSISVIVAAS